MKTIREIFDVGCVEGEYALEIEVEGRRLPVKLDNWTVERDGSVPIGLEYVFKGPCSLAESFSRVDELYDVLDRNSLLYEQERSGVHTHINVQDFTPLQVFTLLTLYYTLEPLLVNWCGEMRKGNHFCLRTMDAEEPIFLLINSAKKRDFKYIITDNIRYAAMNVSSLGKYGSLELRCMRTPTERGDVKTWLSIIDAR